MDYFRDIMDYFQWITSEILVMAKESSLHTFPIDLFNKGYRILKILHKCNWFRLNIFIISLKKNIEKSQMTLALILVQTFE